MINSIKIAVDAMGGDNSPEKTINGIKIHNSYSNNVFYNIFGNGNLIEPILKKSKISPDNYNIFHTDKFIKDSDSPLSAAKKGKDTSMWLSIESLKKNDSDAIVSAGNTGALFVIAKLNLKMIEKIEKPALSALWPNKKGMNIVLDLGANIECNEKNLIDFSLMGSALYKSLFDNDDAKVALLNIGSEELKGNNIIKNTYQLLNENKNSLFEFKGYIEGNHIMDGEVNVIVTDGFTGNVALKTAEGTANFITSELRQAFEIHTHAGSHLGGVHFELTGNDVTECLGGTEGLTETDLTRSYESGCDPRLNYTQSLEMAFLIADMLRG